MKIFETSIYETDSYIKIQTIDGQVQIPEDALIVLRQWSDTFDAFSRWKQNSIPNVNVSSYLTRFEIHSSGKNPENMAKLQAAFFHKKNMAKRLTTVALIHELVRTFFFKNKRIFNS